MIHGITDETVPASQSEELFSHLSGLKNLHKLQGCDHKYTNPMHFKIMLGISIGWFKRFLMPESIKKIKTKNIRKTK